jgi:hypothetical protein
MKIIIGPISLDRRLFFLLVRFGLGVIVFFLLCTGIFLAFDAFLQLLDQIAPSFMGNGWLVLLLWVLLLIFYIILGVAFTRFVASLLCRSFEGEELRARKWMAILSGVPFNVLCLLSLWATIVGILSDVDPAGVYASGVGFVLFGLASCSYLLLLRFFLRRSTAIAHQ